jgi:DNA polymerase-4
LEVKEVFLCADLDAFFVSVEQALNPGLAGKPVIVGGMPGERGVVSSASYEARKFGIHSGMPVSRAHRLCSKGIFLRPNFKNYEAYSRKFKDILELFSPEVEMASIDEAYVNINGTARLFGEPLVLAQKLKKEIMEAVKLPVSIGIARTKPLSKIACDQSKPDGLLMVRAEEEIMFLSPLPVSVLPGIGPKSMEILLNLNISTVSDLLNSSEWVLNTALGNYYKLLEYIIEGGDFHHHESMRSMSHETTLTEDTADRELLNAILYSLIERACGRLRRKNLTAQTLTVKIRFSDFKTISRRERLVMPTNCQQKVYLKGLPLLDDLLKEKKRIRLIGVNFSHFEYDRRQPSLFQVCEDRLDKLNYALDTARVKYGTGCLFAGNAAGKLKHSASKPPTPDKKPRTNPQLEF